MTGIKNPIHGNERPKLLERTWFLESIAAGPPIVASALAAWDAYPDGRYVILGASLAWFALGQLLIILNAYRKDGQTDLEKNHDGLRAAAYVLHETVLRALRRQSNDDPDLRTTIHRVVPPINDPDHIEQAINYVGGNGGGRDRKFPVRAGITGCAVRELAPFIMDRQAESEAEYRKGLVSEWHYTSADAQRATPDRFSAIAIPVKDKSGQRVIAVVYLDTRRKGAFSKEEIFQLAVDACGGISDYVGERYV